MNEFLIRVKTDKTLQLILILFACIFIGFFFFFLRPIFFPKKAPQLPCYGQEITIWWPFNDFESRQFISEFEKFCVKFNIFEKDIREIENNLVGALAEGDYPNVIFIDNDSLLKLEKFLATPTPVAVDSLVAYYNQDVLNFLGISPPRTFDELKNFISKIKAYQNDFYAVGLGTVDITHRSEIIFSLLRVDENVSLAENLKNAIQTYLQFSDPNSEYFSYSLEAGNDLKNFASGRLAMYLGFYRDREEINKINPRLKYSINFSPLNTFPPKFKSYSKIYYLAPIKKGKNEVVDIFISWLVENNAQSLLENFDFVPILKNKDSNFLSDAQNKKIVLDSYNFFGETFSQFNKKVLSDNLDNILINQDELEKTINRLAGQLPRKK
ncbi:MAG: ABC transporter substrate-binding protein [Patescibacteria group bacterium]|nr:ABC transporter substrate-binding protein [Patescibacteria group bacterium]